MKLFEPQVLIIILIIVLLVAIPVWLFWKIFDRTGMNPALAFLVVVPYVGPVIVLLLLAFKRWPVQDAAQAAAIPSSSAYPAPAPVQAPQAVPVSVAAGWLPDPTGMHRLRYWDGTSWTSSIDDGGLTGS